MAVLFLSPRGGADPDRVGSNNKAAKPGGSQAPAALAAIAPHWYRAILAILLVIGPCCLPAAAAAPQRQILSGNVPAAAVRLTPTGRLDRSKRLKLAIALPLRNRPELTQLLHQLYDPASPNYRRYLTPAQFADRFGPTEQDYATVEAFAKAHRLTVTRRYSNRVLLDVEGAVPEVEAAFHVNMVVYRHPTEKRTFYAPDTEPSLDLPVTITHIFGLDNYALPHPLYKPMPPHRGGRVVHNVGSGPDGAYMGKDFRMAYIPGVSVTGSGQAVGLLQFDGYTPSDITYYETLAGLPNVTLTNVLLDGFDGTPTGDGGEVEVSLDIEMVASMAPGISDIIVYEAGPDGIFDDILGRMATDDLAKSLSSSWSLNESLIDPVADGLFQQMAAQGQSFYEASGDADADAGAISFPEDDPYITMVGGTTLTESGSGGPYSSETVWNWGDGVGSSGGISTQYPIPTWQQGISMTANDGSTTMRNMPDVAMVGDNVYVRADGEDQNVGGTSCATPLWGAFTALVNQQALVSGGSTVGFINPAIYAIGEGASYDSDIHDITTGNDFSDSSPTLFPAATGYDLCTGWGSPAGGSLINALAAGKVATGPPGITSPLSESAVAGDVFDYQILANNAPASYGASGLPAGLSMNTATGLISGTLNTTGDYDVIISASNSFGTGKATLQISVIPEPPPTITSPLAVSGTVGGAFGYQINATNNPTGYNATGLPAGLSVDMSTGLISGTPTATGMTNATITASNAEATGTATLQISIVAPPAPVIVNPFTVPYSFTGQLDGGDPYAGLTQGSDGNFYGTTILGGAAENGTVFKVTASGSLTTIYSFTGEADGGSPAGGVIQGSDGNFYGTTYNGGTYNAGTVFEVTESGSLTTLYSFTGGSDGGNPYAGLIQGSDGNFYGTTYNDGLWGYGTVFEVTEAGSLTTLYSFTGGTDGANPFGGVIQGSDGNFYGTASEAGYWGYGSVFELTEGGVLTTLYSFTGGNDGGYPTSSLIQGSDGNFYGTAGAYGSWGYGTAFELAEGGELTTLYSFTGENDGGNPYSGIIQGRDGNFYGTAFDGGSGGYGTVFELTEGGSLTPLYSFAGQNDGGYPLAGVIQGSDGNFYGTSSNYGSGGYGTIYGLISNSIATTVDEPFSYQITAINDPTSFDATGLPLGLMVDTTTGLISGTPTETGTSVVTLSASNIGGTGYGAITIKVLPRSPTITSSLKATGYLQTPFRYHILATNSPTSYGASGLPAGLSVNTSSGLISGTLTAAGMSTVLISASNGYGAGTASLQIVATTEPAPLIVGLLRVTGSAGAAFNYQITATNNPTSYNANGLPPGLTVNTSTGLISGTPTATVSNDATISASNLGGTGYATLVITIVAPPVPAIINPVTIPYSFTGENDGGYPYAGLVQGSNGNFYGTTNSGGIWDYGTVFQVTNGGAFTAIYSFTGGNDGGNPLGALIQGKDGNFYGTTEYGGYWGYGTVFQLTASGSLTTLYSFTAGSDGGNPNAGVIQGSDGNFYGTTAYYGNGGYGTVFEVTVSGSLTTLYSFTGGNDGGNPLAGVIQGKDGNFYGTTAYDGYGGYGTAYEVTEGGSLKTLYPFLGGNDGGNPYGGLIQGSDGNFYGTTCYDGSGGYGTVFEVTEGGALTTLYSFTGANDGGYTYAGVVQGRDGNFYGTTSYYGSAGYGTVFDVTESGALTTLYSFTGGNDGGNPNAGVIQGSNGNFYGTTTYYGSDGFGTVYSVASDSVSAVEGEAFSYQITATNDPTRYGANPLPAGLNFDTATGLISGTPTTAGTTTVNLSASNYGGTGTGTLLIGVAAATAKPAITSALAASGNVGSAFSYEITASNAPSSYGATGLPNGLTVSPGSGLISGTPTATSTSNVDITASNAIGTGSATLLLTIGPVATQTYTISTSSSPSVGGTASGGGIYAAGATATLTATPATDYQFVNWTVSGTAVSTSNPYGFAVIGNESLVANFAATSSTGSLEVAITPAGALDAGAEWNVDGEAWQVNEATVTGLSAGSHTVNFSTVAGYATPASQTVDVLANETVMTTGAYVVSTSTGSLEVTITPAAAVTAGAEWSVDGGAWQGSGATVNGLTTGFHKVSFDAIYGFATPASQNVDIVAGQTAMATGAYAVAQSLAGTYDGLLDDWDGSITTRLSASGKFTGKVDIFGLSHSLKGAFNSMGAWQGTASGGVPVSLQFQGGATGVPGSYLITGTADGTPIAEWHTAYVKGQLLLGAGKYALQLPPETSGTGIPTKAGTATLTVSKTGSVHLSGKLPDGESFSASTALVGGEEGNECFIYCVLDYPHVVTHGQRGYLGGDIEFPSGEALSGTLEWTKPAQTEGLYPGAIDVDLNVAY